MKSRLPLLIRLGVAAILASYAFEKLQDPVAFLKAIREYQLIPSEWFSLLNFSVSAIPITELLAAVCLAIGFWKRGAALITSLLLIVFSSAILIRSFEMMAETGEAFTQLQFDCGCGSGEVIIYQKLMFNLILLLGVIHAGFRDYAPQLPHNN
ncbi:MAG: DoxX family membrane protein [Planctomycetes bacterium]|nr:DoxX family membrane protein [Planctomycetota bacterium]